MERDLRCTTLPYARGQFKYATPQSLVVVSDRENGSGIGKVCVSTSSTDSTVVGNVPVAMQSAFFCNRDSVSSTSFFRTLNPRSSDGVYHIEQAYSIPRPFHPRRRHFPPWLPP
jgi:hypothetical protein